MASKESGAFERVAAYYEALANARKRLEREGPLLLEVLRRAPGERVLDLACGTGLHALWFAENGATVTATDLSEAMIAYAMRHRPHERLRYLAADMRNPPEGEWDLAICMGNSLSLLNTEQDLRAAFARVRERLSPGGLFLFQILNYARPAAQEPRQRIERRTLPEGNLIAVKNLVPEGEHTLLALNFFVEGEGGRFEASVDTAVLRNWSLETLVDVAGEAGLAEVELFGGFDRAPFDASVSPDLIGLFEKG